jgi:hypothetical protein
VRGPYDIGERQIRRRTAESLAGRTNAGKASAHSFGDSCSLKFGNRREDVHLEFPGGRRGVDAFGQADERDPERLQVLQQCDQVLQVATEPIKSPAHDDIEPPPLGISNQRIESGAAILRSTHPTIDILDGRPASGRAEGARFRKLILWLLIDRRNAGVDRGPHDCTSASVVPAFRI